MGNYKKRTKPSEGVKSSKGADSDKNLISMAEVFQVLISNGHSLHNIKQEYTIAQVYLFYEKCKKIEMDSRLNTAFICGQSALLGAPAYDRQGLKSKQDQWNKFVDSLSWEKITSKSKPKSKAKSNSAGLNSLLSLGAIPIVNK